jgi:hypothetical protein
MRHLVVALAALAILCPATAAGAASFDTDRARFTGGADDERVRLHARGLLNDDLAALQLFRPGFAFWSHVFTIPDGSIAYGSAGDGRLLATFPLGADWKRQGRWTDESLAGLLEGESLPSRLGDRRDVVAQVLERQVGPALHNPTRGDFLLPGARRFGGFLEEWGRIYERFGVPAELGLAQAIVESGLSGTIKSEARAIGFCQWLPRNWDRLDRLTPHVIEVQNQTTQASYCAAYLAVLSTKYGSFIPALSEHHAGGTNVGRTVINGRRLGAETVRAQYFTGGTLAVDLRTLSPRTFRDVVGSYGPRSFRYAEMVFGNMRTVTDIMERTGQEPIFAMRTDRALPLDEVARRSGLTVQEVKRYNPALVRRVPRGATVYLPAHVAELGRDVAFWRQPASAEFSDVLDEFLALDETLDRWEDPAFEAVLRDYRRRFRETGTEEGVVMDVVIAYVMEEMPLSRRILAEFRTDPRIGQLFDEGVRLRTSSAR